MDTLAQEGHADVEDLPLPVRRRVEGLKGVHVEFTKLEALYRKELYELNRKVRGIRATRSGLVYRIVMLTAA